MLAWNKQRVQMDNKEEGNGIYNSDTDKRITHILAHAEEGILLLLCGCLR